MKLLVTGGAGFIGSAVVRHFVSRGNHVVTVDALTYAGNLDSLAGLAAPQHVFEHADIRDAAAIRRIFRDHRPDAVMHLAAESHVDRSIDGAAGFVETNIVGTYSLLEVARAYWLELDPAARARFRFHHVSTDEVYGALGPEGRFHEATPYDPHSPYSATKAASDHLVRAWWHTYGLPVVVTHCSNNYGPRQFPEKLIPLTILNALGGESLPVYGRGDNMRDWLFVDDHVAALEAALLGGRPGETYAIGGGAELRNIDVVHAICTLMDELAPKPRPHADLVTFVPDRPGHDFRYAIDASKISRETGWRPQHTFPAGLRATVRWYLDNRGWWGQARREGDRGKRLGLAMAAR